MTYGTTKVTVEWKVNGEAVVFEAGETTADVLLSNNDKLTATITFAEIAAVSGASNGPKVEVDAASAAITGVKWSGVELSDVVNTTGGILTMVATKAFTEGETISVEVPTQAADAVLTVVYTVAS